MVTSVKKGQKDPYKKAGDTAKIVGITLNSTSKAQVLRKITSRLDRQEKTFIVTPNPEFLVFANRNPWFKKILDKADLAIPDGIGLVWASRFLALRSPTKILLSASDSLAKKRPLLKETHRRSQGEASQNLWASRAQQDKVPTRFTLQGRISGTDLMEKLCQVAAKQGWGVYLLGGRPGVAKKALMNLKSRSPGLKGWAESGPKLELAHWDSRGVKKWVGKINQKSPELLFVAFGMGKQEKFIGENWRDLKVKMAMGVGGAFDYLAGEIPRPPAWSQNLGLEWFYRLIRQPWRWRRQLALIEFVWLVLKEKTRK